jgi:hypothetical protein
VGGKGRCWLLCTSGLGRVAVHLSRLPSFFFNPFPTLHLNLREVL